MGQLDRLYALCCYYELHRDFYFYDNSPSVAEHERTKIRLKRMIREAPNYRRPVDVTGYWRYLSDPRRQVIRDCHARLALDPDNDDLFGYVFMNHLHSLLDSPEDRQRAVRSFARRVKLRTWERDNQNFQAFRRSDFFDQPVFLDFEAWSALPWYQTGIDYPSTAGYIFVQQTMLDSETIKEILLTQVPITEVPSDEHVCSVCKFSYGEDESNYEELPSKLGPCGHIFGTECITRRLSEGNNSCPLCRREFNFSQLEHEHRN
jgi:hypothetical protein